MDRSTSEPFLNMRFRVEIEGMPETGVLEVVFPEARLVSRANNGRRARYGTMFLKRGIGRSQEWYLWWDQVRRARKVITKSVTVTLLDELGETAHRWTFRNSKPVAYSISNLNALGHEALTETLELSVGGFDAVTPPLG
jgi:phage tail-like protein